MFNKFLQHTRKPQGIMGRMMVRGMNSKHVPLSKWGLSFLPLGGCKHILDVGCGGGANIAKMLEDAPHCIVDGIDYSEESVAVSKKTNKTALGKRCTIRQGDVSSLPYDDGSLDLVTAFETIYFWPSLDTAFGEILRVLKPGGRFFICCGFDDDSDTTWTNRIKGMTIYRGEDLKKRLLDTGFQTVALNRKENGWICLIASTSLLMWPPDYNKQNSLFSAPPSLTVLASATSPPRLAVFSRQPPGPALFNVSFQKVTKSASAL